MRPDEAPEVAGIIYRSLVRWYGDHGTTGLFPQGPDSCLLFPQVYEQLDPGCCAVAEDPCTGRLAGSCFYHPRRTHVSLGIMTVDPDYFGQGVARRLLNDICRIADTACLPVRLVSSAMNLDSFSLYTRAGFTARAVFQDMTLQVPADGLAAKPDGYQRVRPATMADIAAMVELERQTSGIHRENDLRYVVQNRDGFWHVSVMDHPSGQGLEGFLVSINHPASNKLGPGAMLNESAAAALIVAELNHHRGRSPVWLVPACAGQLVQQLYGWGCRNCELHLLQVRGSAPAIQGIVMPTFMPETA